MRRGKTMAIARFGGAIYRSLLSFYPRELRREFGQEMQDIFTAQLCDVMVERRAAEVVSLWRITLWELLTVALPSRFASDVVMAEVLSFLASAALFLGFFRAVS